MTRKMRKHAPRAERKEKESDATVLLRLLDESGTTLFHDLDGTPYALLRLESGAKETVPVNSGGFRRYLCGLLYKAQGKAPNAQTVADVRATAEARAVFDGPEWEVHLRVARVGESIFLDLADEARRVVEVTADGWHLTDDAPLCLVRPPGIRSLPTPQPGGSLDQLRGLLNLPGEEHDTTWTLLRGYLLCTVRGRGPYPVLCVGGQQGSGKTTACELLRRVLDPHKALLRALPREERDLAVAGHNSYLVAFDNVSRLPEWLSDSLCRLATGAGFGARTLYTDSDETTFNLCRPAILNGIGALATRGDLVERALLVTLPRVDKQRRRRAAEVEAAFTRVHPYVLGALLDAAARGLAHEHEVEAPELPRMADAVTWAAACEGHDGFLQAVLANQAEAALEVLAADPVASAVFALLAKQAKWLGSPTKLLTDLSKAADDTITRSRAWPKTAGQLTDSLERLAPALLEHGVEAVYSRTGKTGRRWRLARVGGEE